MGSGAIDRMRFAGRANNPMEVVPMLRTIIVAAFAVCVAARAAVACTGELLFADDFSDPAKSKQQWKVEADYPESLSFVKGYLLMQGISGGYATIPNVEKDFDLCVDVTIPKVKRPKIGAVADILVKYKQSRNDYLVEFGADGVIVVGRTTPSGTGEELTPQKTYPGVKAGAGQTNSWRLLVKDNVGTLFGNSHRLFDFKLVGQELPPKVLLHGQSNDQSDGPWRFSHVRLARPPRN
jgi:hypothetical protein